MAENKTKPTRVSVAAYIDALTDPTKRADAKVLAKLMQNATGEKPKMWGPSIIGFGSYHYRYDSGREGDMPLVGFSPRKAATVLYITTAFSGSAELLGKLGKHTTSKACLYIKKLADVDHGALETLIVQSVAATRAAAVAHPAGRVRSELCTLRRSLSLSAPPAARQRSYWAVLGRCRSHENAAATTGVLGTAFFAGLLNPATNQYQPRSPAGLEFTASLPPTGRPYTPARIDPSSAALSRRIRSVTAGSTLVSHTPRSCVPPSSTPSCRGNI